MIWVLVRMVLPCHSGGARRLFILRPLGSSRPLVSLDSVHSSSCGCGWIPSDRFGFSFVFDWFWLWSWFCLPSGYLVCSSLITMIRFSSIRPFHLVCIPPASLIRSLACIVFSLSISLPIRLHHSCFTAGSCSGSPAPSLPIAVLIWVLRYLGTYLLIGRGSGWNTFTFDCGLPLEHE